jgi:hypothetical protein
MQRSAEVAAASHIEVRTGADERAHDFSAA